MTSRHNMMNNKELIEIKKIILACIPVDATEKWDSPKNGVAFQMVGFVFIFKQMNSYD